MAVHPRKAIRDAVVAALVGQTAAADRVMPTRIDPIRKSKLPAIAVYDLREVVEATADQSPRELTRQVAIEIAGYVAHTEAVSANDALDALALEIEAAMEAGRYLGGNAAESELETTEKEFRSEDGRSDPLVGIVVLTYAVTYRTTEGYATDLNEFLRVEARHRIPAADENNEARDKFNVRGAP